MNFLKTNQCNKKSRSSLRLFFLRFSGMGGGVGDGGKYILYQASERFHFWTPLFFLMLVDYHNNCKKKVHHKAGFYDIGKINLKQKIS